MWTAKNRRRYDRSALRYPSDPTDDEWAHVGPLISPASPLARLFIDCAREMAKPLTKRQHRG